jgi:hypothetical protein
MSAFRINGCETWRRRRVPRRQILIVNARTESEIDAAFAAIVREALAVRRHECILQQSP